MQGKTIQDFTLQQKIGQGQYGNVYKAEHRKTKQVYAVKVMGVEKFKSTPKLSEFTNNEIIILSKINHPNIIKFVEMLKTANNIYLVYEFCNGGTLAELIKKKKKLTEAEALKIFSEIRSAFEALYNQNILHRDMKPTNILYHDGVIKLADFGFCKELMKGHNMTQTMVGSPIYMAPEVLKGLIYDARADIWSMGVILYEMLYGFCPYQESTIPKLVGLIDNSLLKFSGEVSVSQSTKNLIKKMLTIKYRQRISPLELLNYPLEGISKISSNQSGLIINSQPTLKEVMIYIRRALFYLAETLGVMSDYLEDINCLNLTFLVYKIINAIQKDTMRSSGYWQILNIKNTVSKWDQVCKIETTSLKQFGELIREALTKKQNISLKTKMQLETIYIDTKFFMQLVFNINNQELKNRLLNCLMFSKHFISVMEKKIPDWMDYSMSKKSLGEKEELCMKYAKLF